MGGANVPAVRDDAVLPATRTLSIVILVAAGRAHDEFDSGATSTWVFLFGFVGALIGALCLMLVMERRAKTTETAALAKA